FENGVVQREVLTCGKEDYLRREGPGPGKIRMAPNNQLVDFGIKPNQMAMVAKRDSIQYPFIEEVASWAEGTEHYQFAALGLGTGFGIGMPNVVPPLELFQDLDAVLSRESTHKQFIQLLLAAGLEKYKESFKQRLLEDTGRLGYDLEDIGIGVISNVPAMPPPIGMWVKEK